MNTHEQYVTLTTAKLLKQAGFNWEVYSFYDTNYKDILFTKRVACINWNMSDSGYMFSAPTQAVAMRWLREVKNCILEPYFSTYNDKYMVKIIRPRIIKDVRYFEVDNDDQFYDTYEQAAEVGLQKVLSLLYEKDLLHKSNKCYFKD